MANDTEHTEKKDKTLAEMLKQRVTLTPSLDSFLRRVNDLPGSAFSPNEKIQLTGIAMRGMIERDISEQFKYLQVLNGHVDRAYASLLSLDRFGSVPVGDADRYEAFVKHGEDEVRKIVSPQSERRFLDRYAV